MLVSRRISYRVLGFGLVLVLGACSSVNPPVEPSQSLDPASCLKVDVQGPDTVAEGEGFTAQVTVNNACDDAIRVPLANATAISNGRDTGVEISFHLSVTDPEEVSTPTYASGYPVRWSSVEPHPSYVETQRTVTLTPGDELVRDISWNGQLSDGRRLPSGDYVLFGEFYYTPNGVTDKDFGVIMGQQPFKVVSD